MQLPSRDSATGRALATFRQLWIAVVALLPVLQQLLSDEQFKVLISQYLPKLVVPFTFLAAAVTFYENYRRQDVANYHDTSVSDPEGK